MHYQIFRPADNLKGLVQCFWSLESDRHEAIPKDYFLMADSCVEIIFQYNGGFRNYAKQSARIRFQHSIHSRFVVAKEVGFFGVRLYPHAVGQLLGMPAVEVVNLVMDFQTLFKQAGADLTDQVFNARNSSERVALVSDFLIKATSTKAADPISDFVMRIIANEGQVNLSHLWQQSGLSVKQFERRFKAIAGFAPKYFARVARFQGTKQKYGSTRIRTLTELAHACNYYDQSHFIREFKEFSGVQPFHYFKSFDHPSTDSQRHHNTSVINSHAKYDGYLPCGWFV